MEPKIPLIPYNKKDSETLEMFVETKDKLLEAI